MMKSEILIEMEENVKEMEELISMQSFKVQDAQRFLDRYDNIANRMNELIISRDNWKKKYQELKSRPKAL